MSIYKNPYCLDDPDIRLGRIRRDLLLERFESNLINVKEPSCISIVSERGMGAPTLVRLFLQEFHKRLPFRVVECDLKVDLGTGGNALDFYRALIKHIERKVESLPQEALKIIERLQRFPPTNLDDFFEQATDFLESLRKHDPARPLLLIMYSFDRAVQRFQFNELDWVYLREFNNRPDLRLYYLIVSRRPLYYIEQMHKLERSLFSTIFLPTQWIGLLRVNEATNLIKDIEQTEIGQISWDSWLFDLILEYGGRHPYCTQFLCAHLYDYIWVRGHKLTVEQAPSHLRDIGRELHGYFRRLTDNIAKEGLLDIINMTLSDGYDSYNQDQLELLTELGYFVPELAYKRDYRLFSPLYYEYLATRLEVRISPPKPVVDTPTREIGDGKQNKGEVDLSHKESFDEPTLVIPDIILMEKHHATLHSEIWIGNDQKLGRKIIFKRPLAQSYTEDLIREAQVLAQLDHPNIVRVWGIIEKPLGVTMQFVEGRDLRYYINFGKPFSPGEVIEMAVQLADALVQVHQAGIVHRDIKPENIILNAKDDRPVLIDFDAARARSFNTLTRSPDGELRQVGTPEYFAPEQIIPPHENTLPLSRYNNIGPRTDLFALGLVLYELLTLQPPFKYVNEPRQYVGESLPQPEQGTIPDALYNVISKVLQSDIDKRPGSARILYELLIECRQK